MPGGKTEVLYGDIAGWSNPAHRLNGQHNPKLTAVTLNGRLRESSSDDSDGFA